MSGDDERPGREDAPGPADQPDQRDPDDDPARRLLSRAREVAGPGAARRGGGRSAAGTAAGGGARRRTRPGEEMRWSGAGPDPRDPGRIGDAVRDLVDDRKWNETLDAAGVLGRWERIVGPEIAAHCRPTRLDDGELTLVAESTAWATQIRLLSRQLLDRIAADLGPGLVRVIRVHGPTAPSWQHGPRRVVGRGPRDTYG